MSIADMPVIPSTTGGKCPICGGDVPANGIHVCLGVKVIERSHLQQPMPLSLDAEILAELKKISLSLDTMKETLRQINHKPRRG